MSGIKLVEGTHVDIGVLLDAEGRIVLSPPVARDYFNVNTVITTVDDDTAVIPAGGEGLRTFITDMVITSGTDGGFDLTNDDGVVIFSGADVLAKTPLVVHFVTPLVNEVANNQVEFDKSAAADDWTVYLAGYYAL